MKCMEFKTDCYAYDKKTKGCLALSDTRFEGKKCPFYRTDISMVEIDMECRRYRLENNGGSV